MKKLVSLLLVVVTLLSLSLVGCGGTKGFDYQNRAKDYVTFYYGPDNKLYVTIADLDETITDEELYEEIDAALVSAGAYYNKITEGEYYVEYGSSISVRYKGVKLETLKTAGYLKNEAGESLTDDEIKALTDAELTALLTGDNTLDKAKVEALAAFSGGDGSTKDTDLTVGGGTFIEELETGMVGIKVGSVYYPVVVTFPETYTNTELAGKRVVFFVTVNHILEKKALPENIDYGDKLAIKYQLKLEGEFAQYTDKYTGLTIETDKDGKYKKDEDGNYLYEEEQTIFSLANSTKFMVGLKLNFNGVSEDNPENAAFKDMPIEERFNVPFTFTYTDKIEVEENGEKTEKEITVTAYATVLGIHSVRYFTHEEIVDVAEGETTPAGKLSYLDFCEKIGLKKDEETKKYEFETYEEYLTEVRKNLQTGRDVQIKANRLQSALKVLIEESRVDLRSEEMVQLQKDWIAEVRGNIDYQYTAAQASGYLATYQYMASYYGLKDAKEYIMYTTYGYKYDTIDEQIVVDAEEFVTERLVFWAFIEKEGITLSDEEYAAGVEKYKEMYTEESWESMGASEAAVREALLWDKAMEYLAETYCDFHTKPAATEDDHVNHDH